MSQEKNRVYSYIPNSVPSRKKEMMREIGIDAMEELYGVIPESLRFRGSMNLPEPIKSEMALKEHIEGLLQENISCGEVSSFLGAGCYDHYVPAICDEVNSRSEFLTAYSGETYSDHGKLQAIFEYTSLMGELLDMDVVNYTTYDGSQAAASATRMACRYTGRNEILVPESIHPETLSQLMDYGKGWFELRTVAYDPETGLLDLADLKRQLGPDTAGILIENPNYFGIIEEQVAEIGDMVHAAGGLFIVYADPISLGVLEAPANYGADLACGEIQSLGIHMQYGGGLAGYIASHDDPGMIAEFPNYFYGIMKGSVEGEYGFDRALNQRTSHGSREKAKEYFGTGSGLWAITAGVYLALMGPQGMAEVGRNITAITRYAMLRLKEVRGLSLPFDQSYHFREFVVDFSASGQSVAAINEKLLDHGVFGGKSLTLDFESLGESVLVCVTEKTRKSDIDALVSALEEILWGGEAS